MNCPHLDRRMFSGIQIQSTSEWPWDFPSASPEAATAAAPAPPPFFAAVPDVVSIEALDRALAFSKAVTDAEEDAARCQAEADAAEPGKAKMKAAAAARIALKTVERTVSCSAAARLVAPPCLPSQVLLRGEGEPRMLSAVSDPTAPTDLSRLPATQETAVVQNKEPDDLTDLAVARNSLRKYTGYSRFASTPWIAIFFAINYTS